MARHILHSFVGLGLIESVDANEMLAFQHSELGAGMYGAKVDEL